MNGTATSTDAQIIESAWRDQATWSKTANNLKADLVLWRNLASLAGVLGAFLEVLAASLAGFVLDKTPLLGFDKGWFWLRVVIAILGAVSLAVVPYVMHNKASKDQASKWVRARSASEALKDKIYRYLVGVPPFRPEPSPSDLLNYCQAIKENVNDLYIYAASIDPISLDSDLKKRPLSLTIDEYVKRRVNNQINGYYLPKGRKNARASTMFHNFEFGLGLVAVIMGALASAAVATNQPELSAITPWVAVLTTASAAITAHIAASRYDDQTRIYFATANRLKSLRDEWCSNPNRLDPASIAQFVDNCEQAISTENEEWLAEWIKESESKGN